MSATGSPGEHGQKSMDERQWVVLQADVRSQQRLAAILLATITGQLKDKELHCSCGQSVKLRSSTLDIHHKVIGSGPTEREEWGRKYYGVLASKFLNDIVRGTKYHEMYELICRNCHELRHGQCP
jgi:hypothetical protein